MKKSFKQTLAFLTCTLSLVAAGTNLFAQSIGDLSDDGLFGDFSDDSLFGEDTIEEWDQTDKDKNTTDLSHGIIFQNGSVKIGGSFDTGVSTTTILYEPKPEDDSDAPTLAQHLKDTTVSPNLSATFTLDARPTQTLRMYTKLAVAYPFTSTYANAIAITPGSMYTTISGTVSEYFNVKEMFTDFSLSEYTYFRFGLHTVSWGTGYFYSPVSDLINTSSIDPTNVDAGVNGALNLRTQITFPDTMNCLWIYVIPPKTAGLSGADSSYSAGTTSILSAIDSLKYPGVTPETETQLYLRNMGLAAKGEFVLGGWELGAGAVYQYNAAPKALLTASGTLFRNIGVFGEAVYQYGSSSEWLYEPGWSNKTNIIQFTAGLMRTWSEQGITLAAQYYFDSNDSDAAHRYFTYGQNIAAMASFGKIFGNTDFSATLFGMVNLDQKSFADDYPTQAAAYKTMGIDIDSYTTQCVLYGTLSYAPFSALTFSAGPYITFANFQTAPTVALKLSAKLGGGNF